jgi:cytochrome c553
MSAAVRTIAAAALLAIALPAAAAGDPEAGRKKAAQFCQACHGANGISVSAEFPNLAGQHPDYISAALRHYKNGKRKNPIMQGQVANLSERDIADLAAWFSSQQGLKVKY